MLTISVSFEHSTGEIEESNEAIGGERQLQRLPRTYEANINWQNRKHRLSELKFLAASSRTSAESLRVRSPGPSRAVKASAAGSSPSVIEIGADTISFAQEATMATLTPELRQAVELAGDQPVEITDPQTNAAYVLLKYVRGTSRQ